MRRLKSRNDKGEGSKGVGEQGSKGLGEQGRRGKGNERVIFE